MSKSKLKEVVENIKRQCINHVSYEQAVSDIRNRLFVLQPGELLAIVGPSRVGKSSATREALFQLVGEWNSNDITQPVVWIDNENSQSSGEFSTKGFMLSACVAIKHPIYGQKTSSGDLQAARLEALIARVSEAVLRKAFETALPQLKTKYMVVDESHHVRYVRGGKNVAAAVLDSWKCLAHRTGVILILIGSYALVDLVGLVPHMIGRQRQPLEFPRYKETCAEDIVAFQAVLVSYSKIIPFEGAHVSLTTWDQYLFRGSIGCVGHLSSWLRLALAWMASHRKKGLTKAALQATVFIATHFQALVLEIEDGERAMSPIDLDKAAAPEPTSVTNVTVSSTQKLPAIKNGRRKRKPFQAEQKRRPAGCRSKP